MRFNPRQLDRLVRTLLDSGARTATRYLGPREVMRLTHRHRPHKRARTVEFVLTLGQPNAREREFIELLRRAEEPFPVKVQLRHWPKQKNRRK